MQIFVRAKICPDPCKRGLRVLKSKINETTSARVDDVGSIEFQFFLRLSAAS